jgi:hypothetical protein
VQGPSGHLALRLLRRHAYRVDDPVIHRDEAVGLLFNVSELVVTLRRIELLLEDDDGEEEDES